MDKQKWQHVIFFLGIVVLGYVLFGEQVTKASKWVLGMKGK